MRFRPSILFYFTTTCIYFTFLQWFSFRSTTYERTFFLKRIFPFFSVIRMKNIFQESDDSEVFQNEFNALRHESNEWSKSNELCFAAYLQIIILLYFYAHIRNMFLVLPNWRVCPFFESLDHKNFLLGQWPFLCTYLDGQLQNGH